VKVDIAPLRAGIFFVQCRAVGRSMCENLLGDVAAQAAWEVSCRATSFVQGNKSFCICELVVGDFPKRK
jgi:hypothetical protein